MSKTKVEENEFFTLNDIIDFIGSVEQGTASCTWTSAKQLPREISLLNFSSIQLNASTDLAINMSRMGVNSKQDESKKYSSSDRYKKEERRDRDYKRGDKNRRSSQDQRYDKKRSYSYNGGGKRDSRQYSGDRGYSRTPGAPETKETQEDPEN